MCASVQDSASPTHAKFSRIVVPIDFSREGDEATRVALALAPGGALHLVHVASGDEAESAARLREVAERASGENDSGVELTVAVEQGSRVATIVDYAGRVEADLLVMASHGGSLLTGGVTEQVAMDAPCPVLVLRGEEMSLDANRPVLVAVDGGPASKRAVELARLLAPAERIELVHVARRGETNEDRARLEAELGDVGRVHWVEGDPAPTILNLVGDQGARLLVAAFHEEPERNPLEVGRVGRRLVHSSPVPLLIARV
jgi:nucleotide-binding universal stress UspA family protein